MCAQQALGTVWTNFTIAGSAGPDGQLGLDFGEKLVELAFADDLAVEQVNFALGVGGEARIVRHHADGRAFAMQLLQQLHHGLAVLESRFPVGSSASRIEGEPARARATATRCC